MDQNQFEKLQSAIEAQIKSVVNGKIDGLRNDLGNYILLDTAWKAVDKEWKQNAQPSIDLGTNLRGFGKGVAYLVSVIGGLAGLIAGVVALVRKFSRQ